MTNSTTTSMQSNQNTNAGRKSSDAAPMVITRLSGWIDVNEVKAPRGWIIPTRIHQSAR